MVSVRLLNPQDISPDYRTSEAYRLSQFSAATCYQPDFRSAVTAVGNIDVAKNLFKPRHHTTLQHALHYFSFYIMNIPVSAITFGLHMGHPFYNSSQCSGRYCTKLFTEERERFVQYVNDFITQYCVQSVFKPQYKEKIVAWVIRGIEFYEQNLQTTIELAKDALLKERPFYPGDINLQAKRIAQEQLRCVLSTITPTQLVHTLNIVSLLSLHTVAWNTLFRDVTKMMLDALKPLEFAEYDQYIQQERNYYVPEIDPYNGPDIVCIYEPIVDIPVSTTFSSAVDVLEDLYLQGKADTLIDTLQYDPNLNPVSFYNESTLSFSVEISVSAFGQDQRHRTIKRSNPYITNKFLVPPLVRQLPNAEVFITKHMEEYWELVNEVSMDDMIHFIPYGSVVRYKKEASVGAYLHSLSMRLCWNAEGTISRMEEMTLLGLFNKTEGSDLSIGAPCKNNKCHEGKRFCGRDLSSRKRRELI